MKSTTSNSEKILKNVRSASIEQFERDFGHVDFDSPVFKMPEDTLDFVFAQNFVETSGKFVYCENSFELQSYLKALFDENQWSTALVMDPEVQSVLTDSRVPFSTDITDSSLATAGITQCEFLVARLGSILISSNSLSGRRMHVYPENHIVIAYTSQLVADIKDALKGMKEKYVKLPSMISLITGPSRTADIEKTLVMGAHGPKNLYLFLVEDR